jgi:hypothetical protein
LTIKGLSEKIRREKGGGKMNTVIKSFFVILVVFALSASAYAVDPSSILVYWPCDEGSGQEVIDKSGNNRNAEWREGVETRADGAWVDGPAGFDKALDFSIGNYCVVYETDADPDLLEAAGSVPFTVAYYVKTTVDTGKGRTVDMGSHGCTNGWHSAVNAGKIILEASDKDYGGGCVHHWDHPVADGEWHHVAHSIIPGQTAHTYVDGVQNLEGFDALNGRESIAPFEGRELDLGVSFRFDTEYFPGQLDEIVILNYALSEAEVNVLMAGPAIPTAVELTGKATATWAAIKAGY